MERPILPVSELDARAHAAAHEIVGAVVQANEALEYASPETYEAVDYQALHDRLAAEVASLLMANFRAAPDEQLGTGQMLGATAR